MTETIGDIKRRAPLLQQLKRSGLAQGGNAAFYDWVARTRVGRVSPDSAILVSGSPRSGTTWLAEILSTVTGRPLLDEPLKLSAAGRLTRMAELTWRTYRKADAEDPGLDTVLKAVLSATYLRPNLAPKDWGTTQKLLQGSPVIVKEVRSHLLLPYFHRRFPKVPVVELLRNPYAVIASQTQIDMGYWRDTQEINEAYFALLKDHPEMEVFDPPKQPVEILAIQWCLEHAYLRDSMKELTGIHVLRYEDLYHDYENTLRGILEYLGLAWSDEYSKFAKVKSRSVSQRSALGTEGDPTMNYMKVLSEDQQTAIGRILERFDCPFYPA